MRTIHLLVKAFPSELLLSNMDMRRITIKASLQLPRQHCSLNICRYIGWVDTYCTISEAKIQITLLKMRRGASLQFLSNDWIWWAGLYYLQGVWQGLTRERCGEPVRKWQGLAYAIMSRIQGWTRFSHFFRCLKSGKDTLLLSIFFSFFFKKEALKNLCLGVIPK